MKNYKNSRLYKNLKYSDKENVDYYINLFLDHYSNLYIDYNDSFISLNNNELNDEGIVYRKCWFYFDNNKKLCFSYRLDDKGKVTHLYNLKQKNVIKELESKETNLSSKIPFYEQLTLSEQLIADRFKKEYLSIIPGSDVDYDSHSTYGFYLGPKTELNRNKICWLSKKGKSKHLIFNYRTEIGTSKPEEVHLTSEKIVDSTIKKMKQLFSHLKTTAIVNGIKAHHDFNYQPTEDLELTLMNHQKAGVLIANENDRYAFFYDTGTGKTIMALEIMMNKYLQSKKDEINKFLVIAPKILIKSAWLEDAKNFPKMKLLPLSHNITVKDYCQIYDYWQLIDKHKRKYTDDDGELLHKVSSKEAEEILVYLKQHAHHFIINMDAILDNDKYDEIFKGIDLKGLIIDESVIIKNYYSESAKTARCIAKNMQYVYLLSGLPAPNNTSEYYSQMSIVDPKTFKMSYNKFISTYYNVTGRFNKISIKNKDAEKEVSRMVSNKSITIKKEECIDLPPLVQKKVCFELQPDSQKFYNDIFRKEFTRKVDKNGKIVYFDDNNRMAIIAKLREVAAGIYIDDNGNHTIHDDRFNSLFNLIDNINESDPNHKQQIIIWCNFVQEIDEISSLLREKGFTVSVVEGSAKDNDAQLKSFKDGETDILVANIMSLKYGVTLTNCHHEIFNTLNYSYSDYYQAKDRIYRNGAIETCYVYCLTAENTIDDTIFECVMNKASQVKLFEKLIKSNSAGFTNKEIKELLNKIK